MIRRIIAAVLLAVVVGTGLAVHAVGPDGAASDITGDALYAIAVYLFIVLLAPRLRPLAVGAIAAGWCVAVELFQLTGLPAAWGASFRPIVLVLGTAFDTRDLVIYVLAGAAAVLVDTVTGSLATRARHRHAGPRSRPR